MTTRFSSPQSHSVSLPFFNEILRTAGRLGYVLPEMPLSAPMPGGRVPLGVLRSLLESLQIQREDAGVGLVLGSRIEPACFHVLGYLVVASSTIGRALEYVQQFQALVLDCARVECRQEGDCMRFDWQPLPLTEPGDRALIDLVLAATRTFGIWATGIDEPFLEVRFQYAAPGDTDRCQRIFGHPGRYGCAGNGFSIPVSWCQRGMRGASETLQPVIRDQAEQQLQQIRAGAGVLGQLTEVLTRLLPQGHATIECAAEALHLSSRTLQRLLAERNTRFCDVLRQVRMQRARYLLQCSTLSLTEIAVQVGYREQSSFSTAYKQWAGVSPRMTRLQHSA